LGLSFFGLTYDVAPQVRANLFKQIHEIVFHGNGGYDWNTVYNMPIWLRKYTFAEIKKYYEEQKEAAEGKSNNKGKQTVISSDGKIKTPELLQQVKNTKKPIKYS
jgi:hypothetical protein